MNIFFKRLGTAVIFLWVVIVSGSWLKQHLSSLDTQIGHALASVRGDYFDVLLPLIVLLFFGWFLFAYLHWRKQEDAIIINYSWLGVVLCIFLLGLFSLNIAAFFRITGTSLGPVLFEYSWIGANVAFVEKLALLYLWMFSFSLAVYTLGSAIKRIFLKAFSCESVFLNTLVVFVLGLFGWSLLGFLLAYVHYLRVWPLSIIFLATLLIEWREVKECGLFFFENHELELHPKELIFWLVFVALFIISLNTIDALTPIPTGFDDSTFYLNRAHLISQYHALVPGGLPFPYEILASFGYLFSNNASFTLGTNLVYSLFGCVAVFGVTNFFVKKKTLAMLATTLYLSFPMTIRFIFMESKVEALLFFIATVAIWLFFVWIENKKNVTVLLLTFFIFGFACLIKATAIFFLPAVMISILWVWKKWGVSGREKMLIVTRGVLLMVVPFFVWIAYALTTKPISELTNVSAIISTNAEKGTTDDDFNKKLILVDRSKCIGTTAVEDVGRYSDKNDSILQRFALMFWKLTMNNHVGLYVTEIGFVPLIFLGIAVVLLGVFLIFNKGDRAKETSIVFLIMATTYWILWEFFALEIPWYGYPGFVFFFILTSLCIAKLKNNKAVYYFLLAVVVFQLIILLSLRLQFFADPWLISYASNKKSADALYDLPKTFSSIINDDSESKIFMVTTAPLIYFINNNDKRVFRDSYLDKFSCIDNEQDDALTIKVLKNLDIKYIYINNYAVLMESDVNGTLHTKFKRFTAFADKNLVLVKKIDNQELFIVP